MSCCVPVIVYDIKIIKHRHRPIYNWYYPLIECICISLSFLMQKTYIEKYNCIDQRNYLRIVSHLNASHKKLSVNSNHPIYYETKKSSLENNFRKLSMSLRLSLLHNKLASYYWSSHCRIFEDRETFGAIYWYLKYKGASMTRKNNRTRYGWMLQNQFPPFHYFSSFPALWNP